jgi:hypothetical protein
MGPKIKASNPLTANPGTKIEANQKQKPLIIYILPDKLMERLVMKKLLVKG